MERVGREAMKLLERELDELRELSRAAAALEKTNEEGVLYALYEEGVGYRLHY